MAKTWADKPDSNSGRVVVLNLEFAHGRSGFQPTAENLPKGRHGSGGFLRWIFAVKFWSQNTKEISAEKIRRPKSKSAGARPPRNPPARPPKIAAKPTNTNSLVKSLSTRRALCD